MNYNHLYYFWSVVKHEGVGRAAQILHVSQPALTAQIRNLESFFKDKLFEKKGRQLQMTEFGKIVFRYADEMFSLTLEMQQVLKSGGMIKKASRLTIGIVDAVPKMIAHEILKPILSVNNTFMTCIEDKRLNLLAQLLKHEIDAIVSDAPLMPSEGIRAYNHMLGESYVGVFAFAKMVSRYKKGFPTSLDQAPMLLPTNHSQLRKDFDFYCQEKGIFPNIRAEFDDTALLKIFAREGTGLFLAPVAIQKDIQSMYGASLVGSIKSLKERFYFITSERKLYHPILEMMKKRARLELFD